ncbi:Uncharacterized membrane protein [Clostridium sp. DSM 8431]|uniref:SdpI family protein n=1 Tax=Clostridium sp. DSM 8431 TaxID=1761781 RepID=UPI0008E507A1|nr:SdpI family protein [Clostridium sp. DSM 8431]SFU69501.1 Uncharacterized membrane protein [Clostridium sp. DSM 8431]
MKKNKKLILISTIVCLLPILLSITLYDKLPSSIAIHFSASGQPNNYAPKFIAAFGLPIIMAISNALCIFVLDKDPKKENSSKVLNQICLWIIPILSITLTPITLFKSLGTDIPINIIVPAMIGILFVVIGNYLPKCKQNNTVGIKLPWTLKDSDNWNKTHHLAGYLWILGGAIVTISTFLNSILTSYIMFIAIGVMVLVPTIYSYAIYKNK